MSSPTWSSFNLKSASARSRISTGVNVTRGLQTIQYVTLSGRIPCMSHCRSSFRNWSESHSRLCSSVSTYCSFRSPRILPVQPAPIADQRHIRGGRHRFDVVLDILDRTQRRALTLDNLDPPLAIAEKIGHGRQRVVDRGPVDFLIGFHVRRAALNHMVITDPRAGFAAHGHIQFAFLDPFETPRWRLTSSASRSGFLHRGSSAGAASATRQTRSHPAAVPH